MSYRPTRRDVLTTIGGTTALSLAGCFETNNPSSNNQGGDNWRQSTEEIEYLTWQLSFLKKSAESWGTDFEDEYGIKATWVDKPAKQYIQWFQSRLTANNAPQVANIPFNWYTKYTSDDVWADIEQHANDELMQTFTERFGKNQIEFARQDGTLYGLPWYLGSDVLYYKNEWFEKAGLSLDLDNPWTFQQFLDNMEMAVEKTDTKYGWTAPTSAEYPWWLKWWRGWEPQIQWLTDDQTGAAFDTDACVTWLTRLRDQTKNGIIPEMTWTARKQSQYKQFASGNTVCCLGTNSGFRLIKNSGDWVDQKTLGITSFPKNANAYAPMFWSIPAPTSAAEKKAAVRFIEIVTNEKWSKDFLRKTTVLVSNLQANKELSNNKEFVKNNPILAKLYEQFNVVQEAGNIWSPPQHPKSGNLLSACNTEFTSAALGEKDPEQAVSDAANQVNSILG